MTPEFNKFTSRELFLQIICKFKNWIITFNFCSPIYLCCHIYIIKLVTFLYPPPVKPRERTAVKLDRCVDDKEGILCMGSQGRWMEYINPLSVGWLDLVVWEGNNSTVSHPRTTWGSGDGCLGRQGSWALHTLASLGSSQTFSAWPGGEQVDIGPARRGRLTLVVTTATSGGTDYAARDQGHWGSFVRKPHQMSHGETSKLKTKKTVPVWWMPQKPTGQPLIKHLPSLQDASVIPIHSEIKCLEGSEPFWIDSV